MRNRNIGFGIFLLSIGIIWALVNIGIIDWSVFESVLVLWPLLLVMAGINVVFRDNPIVKTVTWLLFLAIVIVYGYYNDRNAGFIPGRAVNGEKVVVQKLTETGSGELRLALGGTRLFVDSETQNLMDAYTEDPDVRYTEDYRNNNETAVLKFEKKLRHITFGRRMGEYNSEFHLNKDVLWDIDMDIGAVSGTLDMSELKVRDLDMDVGAGNLKLICGNKQESSRIKIDAGASKIGLVVPKDAGVRIKVDGVLSKENLENLGWDKRSGGYYVSPNYDGTASKIDVDIDMGAGKLTVDVE